MQPIAVDTFEGAPPTSRDLRLAEVFGDYHLAKPRGRPTFEQSRRLGELAALFGHLPLGLFSLSDAMTFAYDRDGHPTITHALGLFVGEEGETRWYRAGRLAGTFERGERVRR